MANFAGFICAFLVAFGPLYTCRAQSLIMAQVRRLSREIDTMVQTSTDDAATYLIELQGLLGNLNTSATTDLANIDSDVSDFITSFESEVNSIVADADDVDVSECTDSANIVVSRADAIRENLNPCVNREVDQAKEEVALTSPYVNSQLNTLVSFQTLAQICISRFDESEETTADATQALACVQPLHRAAQLFVLRFELIIDIKLAEDLFNGYETRVATCTSTATSALGSLKSNTQEFLDGISICVTDAIDSSS